MGTIQYVGHLVTSNRIVRKCTKTQHRDSARFQENDRLSFDLENCEKSFHFEYLPIPKDGVFVRNGG